MNFKIRVEVLKPHQALSDKTNRIKIGQEMTEKKQISTFWARMHARTHTHTYGARFNSPLSNFVRRGQQVNWCNNWPFLFVVLHKPTLLPSTFNPFSTGTGRTLYKVMEVSESRMERVNILISHFSSFKLLQYLKWTKIKIWLYMTKFTIWITCNSIKFTKALSKLLPEHVTVVSHDTQRESIPPQGVSPISFPGVVAFPRLHLDAVGATGYAAVDCSLPRGPASINYGDK